MASNEANIKSTTTAALVEIRSIYRRQPPYTQYSTVQEELQRHLSISRAVNIASLQGYAKLLEESDYHVELTIMSRPERKTQRINSARHIFRQYKKDKSLPKEASFQDEMVYVSDINNDSWYYGGVCVCPIIRGAHLPQ